MARQYKPGETRTREGKTPSGKDYTSTRGAKPNGKLFSTAKTTEPRKEKTGGTTVRQQARWKGERTLHFVKKTGPKGGTVESFGGPKKRLNKAELERRRELQKGTKKK